MYMWWEKQKAYSGAFLASSLSLCLSCHPQYPPPSQNHHSIETFIDLVQHDINDAKILNTKRPKDNLTKGEQKALEELSKRDDIIITNADKEEAIVILDIDKYISEAQR